MYSINKSKEESTDPAYLGFASVLGDAPLSGSALVDPASVLTVVRLSGEVAGSVAGGVVPGTKRASRPPHPEQNVTEF